MSAGAAATTGMTASAGIASSAAATRVTAQAYGRASGNG